MLQPDPFHSTPRTDPAPDPAPHPHPTRFLQAYTTDRILFTYTALPSVSINLVPPAGPLAGGTRIVMYGAWRAGGDSYACRFFGEAVVAATADPAAESLSCLAPSSAEVGPTALDLTLNGQQWVENAASFEYSLSAQLSAVLPDISPNVGGLIIEAMGSNLANGSQYQCRFGPTATVSATFDAQAESVLCATPAGLLGRVPVRVSINGQQFSAVAPQASLIFYDVDQVDDLSPFGASEVASVLPSSEVALDQRAYVHPGHGAGGSV